MVCSEIRNKVGDSDFFVILSGNVFFTAVNSDCSTKLNKFCVQMFVQTTG